MESERETLMDRARWREREMETERHRETLRDRAGWRERERD